MGSPHCHCERKGCSGAAGSRKTGSHGEQRAGRPGNHSNLDSAVGGTDGCGEWVWFAVEAVAVVAAVETAAGCLGYQVYCRMY